MDIVTATPSSGSPFHNHDVREWSRLDSITGVLERARLETDHWTANTATTSHKYNKVVDSRARSGADGNHQQARRKLEVFQSQVPGGRIQVIKTQTVSSSHWSSQQITNGTSSSPLESHNAFADLKLSVNPLDLTSEKAKASVGRGVGRRPPSRSRIRDDILARTSNLHATATTNLHRVSRLCHQIHNSAVKQTFGKTPATSAAAAAATARPIDERESSDGVEITDVTDDHDLATPPRHTNLSRTKSTSSEDFFEKRKSLEDLEDLEQLQTWRRTSKLRRSLQYPKQKDQPNKPPDLPTATGSVRKLREDLETGRRLSTALRGNNVDLDALDQILKSISNSSISSAQSDARPDDSAPDAGAIITARKQQKRDSFVTVESIQAVRDKLRRTSSPSNSIYEEEEAKTRDEDDDGIVTDRPVNLQQLDNSSSDTSTMSASNTNRRYERSAEMDTSTKEISGTGSLESRNKFSNYSKQDDWFSRRKSYGFEQMQQPHTSSDSLKRNKNRNESSTDSGICRSTEIVVVSPPSKANVGRRAFDFNDVIKDDNVTNVKKYAMIFENKNDGKNAIKNAARSSDGKRHSIAVDESKYMSSNREDNQFKRTSLVVNDNNSNANKEDDSKRTNKKVEFCKTEVHFAADSGRINIVETDEKPPPTQRFRRRRRNSGPSEDYSRNGLPVQHFGDSTYEKFLFGDPADEPSNGIYENLQNGDPDSSNCLQSTKISANVTVNAAVNGNYFELDEEPHKDIENEAPRGILKNKPIKPRPFLLGVNNQDSWAQNSSSDSQEQPVWKSTVTLKKTAEELRDPQEFQKLRQHLRPTNRRLDYSSEDNSTQPEEKPYYPVPKDTGLLSPPVDDRCSSWSVADRIKQVEELKWTENKGYSTKVNFGDGEATVVENKHPTWPRNEEYKESLKNSINEKSYKYKLINDQIEEDLKYLNQEVKNLNLNNKHVSKSPLNNYNHKLSSPFLVGKSRSRTNSLSSDPETVKYDKKIDSPKVSRRDPSPSRFGQSVLRQPKKSEMAYFGVNTSQKQSVVRTAKLTEKPDLLQFNNNETQRKTSYISSAPTSAPIYENMSAKPNKPKTTFDSSILEELTKAADEILLAVNGYTDEERSRVSTDDELRARRRNDKLDTIAENKSWKQTNKTATNNHISRIRNDKHKSSNSSIDSITRDVQRSFEQLDRKTSSRATSMDKLAEQKTRKKVASDAVQKTTTKARRLQRASSREALLHSHGSSSEDLPNHSEVMRKPRLVKRTKTTQLSVTATGLEMKKPSRKPHEATATHHKSKHAERTLESNLPEIRHKMAVTTIRSTAEKQAASRERAKLRSEEAKKKQASATKRETSKVIQSSKSVDRSKRSKESGRHTAIINQTKKSSTRNDVLTSKR